MLPSDERPAVIERRDRAICAIHGASMAAPAIVRASLRRYAGWQAENSYCRRATLVAAFVIVIRGCWLVARLRRNRRGQHFN